MAIEIECTFLVEELPVAELQNALLEKARNTFERDGPPPWFAGSEVTAVMRFKSAQLAMTGKPDNG